MTIEQRIERVEKQNRRLKWAMTAACVVAVGAFGVGCRGEEQSGKWERDSEIVSPANPEFTNSVGMTFVHIQPGEFLMGSPADEQYRDDNENQHRVRITQPFMLGVHEVTQAQWRSVMGTAPSHFEGDNLPVEKVSWLDAVEFCQKLSRKEGKKYRLPTEAEWEYACRAGTATPFHTGRTLGSDRANYNGTYRYGSDRVGIHRKKTTAVGSFQPNAWGLYDMHGNVYEWCQDKYQQGTASRVLRGGSWRGTPGVCRSAFRYRNSPSYRVDYVGFRVVLDLPD